MKICFLTFNDKPSQVRTLGWLVVFLLILLPSLSQAQTCSIALKPTVSGCYPVSGVSKATVSVEVSWSNAAANDYIVVTSGTSSRTITPGVITVAYKQLITTITGSQTIVSPQVVAFEVNANSTAGSVQARFANNTACTITSNFVSPAPCQPTACGSGELGGTVFKDYNDNGVRESGESAGVSDVAVKAIACDGTVYTTTTDGYGRYALAVPAAKYPVRVEFSNVPGVYNLGIQGTNSGTSVQFVATPSCAIDLGVSNPLDYCSDIPQVFIPCYTYGDPLIAGGTSAVADAVIAIPYGVGSSTFQGEKPIAPAAQVGSVWGLAYNKYTKRLFYASVLKRHTGLGPAGLSGIYVTNYTNPASPTTTTFLSVSAVGIDVGTIPSNTARGLQGDKTLPSHDPDAFTLTAKVGIGGLEVSEDGNTLWLVNLKDGKLYSIDITQYNLDGTTRPTATNVRSFSIPASCVGGTFRPWALHVSNGKVYVGGVCDAQLSGNRSNLRASVYELSGGTFTQIFDFPLTYPKGYPAAANTNITGWFPWTDRFSDLIFSDGRTLRYPVPIFTDIDFDVDGSMVLAFGDRTGFQGGDQNYSPTATDTRLYETNSQAGDILRAYSANGTFILENNAKAGPSTGYGPGNSQGPGFGEFYNDNWLWEQNDDILYHAEMIMGGLALKPGSGEVIATAIDAVDKIPYSGGIRYFDNNTGQYRASYNVYTTRGPGGTAPGTFAKATGLGEPELSCKSLETIQIGNRVWMDANKDGVQDACENPLRGVRVDLYKGTTRIASTTTNASGNYYFSSLSSLTATGAGTWFGSGADTTLLPNTAYSVVFGATQFGNTQFANNLLAVNNSYYRLTAANSTTVNANDQNDSDATISTVAGITAPAISLTTAAAGSVNHTYDVGFVQTASLGDYVFVDADRNGQQNTGDTPIPGVTVTLLSSGTVLATTTTNASGLYSFTGLVPGVPYSVSFTTPSGYTATIQNNGNDATDSDGNQTTGLTDIYSLTAGENNLTVDMGYYLIPASLGDYVFVDTNKDGIQNTGDTPLPGVIVTLYQNGSAVATTTTNADGLYSFTSLTPSVANSYVVGFTTPTGYTATLANVGSFTADSDASPLTGRTQSVTLAPGENNPTLDAGFYLIPASLGAYAFIDANKDGIQNAGDTPLPGVTVTLYQNGSAVATTTTNASGLYSFTGLTPGTANGYVVGFTPPAEYTATLANVGSFTADSDANPLTGRTQSVTLAPGENNLTLDAGFYLRPASLGDYAFIDANKDGIQNAGDSPLAGVTVTLYQNGSAVATTTTNSSGLYSFTGLAPGTANSYVVGFTTPTNYTATISNVGSFTADSDANPVTGLTQSVTLAGGENNPTLDAGFYLLTASLGDYVFEDVNRNGIQDTGDVPIIGVRVTLLQSGSVVANAVTAANGLYSFTGLTPDIPYSVSFTAPAGYSATLQNVGNTALDSDGNPATGLTGPYTLTANENNPTVDMGYYRPASLGDYVFEDANRNGIQDGGDGPIPGVTVTLISNGTVVATTTTNANGLYSFTSLTPGIPYSVSFTTPATYLATTPNAGSNDTVDSDPVGGITAPVTLTSGENNSTLDAGFYLIPASLGNFVFEDVNKDGLQNAGDLPIQGAVVTLVQSGTVAGTTTTNAGGMYSFAGLTPGIPYSVSFATPAGLQAATLANVGTDDTIDSDPVGGITAPVTLTASENNLTLDAGFVRAPVTYSITKTVNRSRVAKGQMVTYTVSMTNTSPTTATNVIVTDVFSSSGLTVVGSGSVSTGSFSPSATGGTWTIPTLTGGQVATLSYQAQANAEGLAYNVATAPDGTTATACLTVPFHVCENTPFEFLLSTPSSFSAYQWSLNGVPIPGATSATLSATAIGEYTLTATNSAGCPEGSCCPFVIVADPAPSLTARAVAATCIGSTPRNDASITLVGSSTNAVSYNISLGSSFSATTPLFATDQPLTGSAVGKVLLANQPNPASAPGTTYTIRVYSAEGCYNDMVVVIPPAQCQCPTPACAPFTVRKVVRR